MKRLLAFSFCLVAMALEAAHVQFDITDFVTGAIARRTMYVKPTGTPKTNLTDIVTGDALRRFTDTSGQCIVSNMTPGVYSCLIFGPETNTTFSILVPDSTNLLNAVDLLTATTSTADSSGYTIAQANAKFVLKNSGWASNLVVTNLTVYGGVTGLAGETNRVKASWGVATNLLTYGMFTNLDTVWLQGVNIDSLIQAGPADMYLGWLYVSNNSQFFSNVTTFGTNESYYLRMPTGAGSGKVLKGDAAGNATWQNDEVGTNSPSSNLILTNTIFVAKNGDDSTGTRGDASKPYATLTNAFASITNGDTLLIYPGDYIVGLTNKIRPLEIKNVTNVSIIGVGMPRIYATNNVAADGLRGNLLTISNSMNIRISGLEMIGTPDHPVDSNALANAINFHGQGNKNVLIEKCSFRDWPRFGIIRVDWSSVGDDGITVRDSYFGNIGSTVVVPMDGGGVDITGSNWKVENCYFEQCMRGIEVYALLNSPLRNIELIGNRFIGCEGASIIVLNDSTYATNLQSVLIANNDIEGWLTNAWLLDNHGIDVRSGIDIDISHNKLRHLMSGAYAGIIIAAAKTDAARYNISGNTLYDIRNGTNATNFSGGAGIWVYNSADVARQLNQVSIVGNTISQVDRQGIMVCADNTLVANNTIANVGLATNLTINAQQVHVADQGIWIRTALPQDQITNILVTGNIIADIPTFRPTNTTSIGIQVDDEVYGAVVQGNYIGPGIAAFTNFAGVGCVYGASSNQVMELSSVGANTNNSWVTAYNTTSNRNYRVPLNDLLGGGGGGITTNLGVIGTNAFGYLSIVTPTNIVAILSSNSWTIVTNWALFLGNKTRGSAVTGKITNNEAGYYFIHGHLTFTGVNPAEEYQLNLLTNGSESPMGAIAKASAQDVDSSSFAGTIYMPSNTVISIGLRVIDIASNIMTIRQGGLSMVSIGTLDSGTGGGSFTNVGFDAVNRINPRFSDGTVVMELLTNTGAPVLWDATNAGNDFDGNPIVFGYVPTNTATYAGVVSAGTNGPSKVWKTDASGVPGWREDVSGGPGSINVLVDGSQIGSEATNNFVSGPGILIRGTNWSGLSNQIYFQVTGYLTQYYGTPTSFWAQAAVTNEFVENAVTNYLVSWSNGIAYSPWMTNARIFATNLSVNGTGSGAIDLYNGAGNQTFTLLCWAALSNSVYMVAPTNNGTSGQVLTRDSGTNTYWATPAAGSADGIGGSNYVGTIDIVFNNAPTITNAILIGTTTFSNSSAAANSPASISLYGTNASNRVVLTVLDNLTTNSVLVLPRTAGAAGQILKLSTATNLDWAADDNTGGTPTLSVSNITVSSTNQVVLDVGRFDHFKLSIGVSNCNVLVSNQAFRQFNCLVYFQQPSNGIATLDSFYVLGGHVQTNAALTLTATNDALDLLELKPGFFTSNVLAYWPKDFYPRIFHAYGITTALAYGTIQFSNTAYAATENMIAVTGHVSRIGAAAGTASVHVITSNGTALANSDYLATNITLSWGDGVNSTQQFFISITNDTDVESSETFSVLLSNVVTASLGSDIAATVTIADNDADLGSPGFVVANTNIFITARTVYTNLSLEVPSTADNRLLFALLAYTDTGGGVLTNVGWGTSPTQYFTRIFQTNWYNANGWIDAWYLTNPDVGTNNTYFIPNQALDEFTLIVGLYTNVHQTTPIGTVSSTTNQAGAYTTNALSGAIGDVGFTGIAATLESTPGGGLTLRRSAINTSYPCLTIADTNMAGTTADLAWTNAPVRISTIAFPIKKR